MRSPSTGHGRGSVDTVASRAHARFQSKAPAELRATATMRPVEAYNVVSAQLRTCLCLIVVPAVARRAGIRTAAPAAEPH